jgi:alkylhydroperoxidase family enzyme
VSRIPPAPPEAYVPLYGEDAPLRQQVYANAPHLVPAYQTWMGALRDAAELPHRLVELIRLRVAFHNQCRSCMAIRYTQDDGEAVGEDLVCSLEKPMEAPDLTEAEKAALAYADSFATDHLSVDESTFARLREYFTDREILELGFHVATFVGYGRLAATLDMVDDLPEEYADAAATLAPWEQRPHYVL